MKKVLYSLFLFWALIPLLGYPQNSVPVDFEALDSYIEKAVNDYQLTGLAVSIVKDSAVVFKKAYGLRNARTGEPLTTGSLFNIASCSKAFTAAGLGMVVSEDKLKWKDKVIDYLPGFQLADPCITANLNMFDILSHRTGLGTFLGDLLWYHTDYSSEEIIHRMRYLPITREFRSEYGYQNNMYLIAGEIIERVDGQSWSNFIYEHIFTPLGMNESRTSSTHLTDGQDIAYPHLNGKLWELYMQEPFAAGSIFSSVDEMSYWITMLLNEGRWNNQQVMAPEIIEEMFSPKIALNVSAFMKKNGTNFNAYGLGWVLFDYYGKKIVEHSGGMPGYISKVTLVPEDNLGMVILTNDENNLTSALRYKILDEFFERPSKDWAGEFLTISKKQKEQLANRKSERENQRVKNTRPSLNLSHYAGLYMDKMYGDARIEMDGKSLKLILLPTAELFTSAMEHWHFDTFRIKFRDEFLPEGFVTFHFDSQANISGFTIDLPNPDFHFFNLDFKRVKERNE